MPVKRLDLGISFNPRARVGRDPPNRELTMSIASFNPRARVGRDGILRGGLWGDYGFNPRARVGRDLPMLAIDEVGRTFQSTRPRGARPSQ